MALNNSIAARRELQGWSQAELAAQTGIARTTVSVIELGKASPSVKAALAIARALETSVEALFADSKDESAAPALAWQPTQGEARVWSVRDEKGHRLYPVEALDTNPIPHDGVLHSGGVEWRGVATVRTLTLATCDPAARLLAHAYEQATGTRMLVFPRSGKAALRLLHGGLVDMAGLHASTKENPEANPQRVREALGTGWILARAAIWESGIASRNPIRLAGKAPAHRRWAIREQGSVAREVLDTFLEGQKPKGHVVPGHREAAKAVGSGWAEAAVTLRLCAAEAGLTFQGLRHEHLDLVFPERRMADRHFRALIQLLDSRNWRETISDLPGYDGRENGALVRI